MQVAARYNRQGRFIAFADLANEVFTQAVRDGEPGGDHFVTRRSNHNGIGAKSSTRQIVTHSLSQSLLLVCVGRGEVSHHSRNPRTPSRLEFEKSSVLVKKGSANRVAHDALPLGELLSNRPNHSAGE